MSAGSPARARVGSRSHLTQPQPMATAAPGLGPLSSASGTGSHGTGFGSTGSALATNPLGMPLAAAGSAASAAAGKLFAGVNVLPTVSPTSLGRDFKRGGVRRVPARLLQYLKRLVRFSQMDFEVAMWQMVHVLFSQQRAYVSWDDARWGGSDASEAHERCCAAAWASWAGGRNRYRDLYLHKRTCVRPGAAGVGAGLH